ncbi:MAG: hypothetical protein HF973_12175 [Chloroflexi bacterium]|nr:hypothetical protein [Chloroflexota bacterium]
MNKNLLILFPVLALFVLLTLGEMSQAGKRVVQANPIVNHTTPGALQHYVTTRSIGFEWPVTGDDNHNTVVTVQYREQGAAVWKQALPLFRVDFNGANTLAGSILFLEPGTTYEVQLALSDPDGGSDNRLLTIATRAEPEMPVNGRIRHVIPGTGGGTGTEANPFRGLDAAQAAAQPGDIFLLHTGYYPAGASGEITFNVDGSPGNTIVWKAAGDGEVTLDSVRIAADYIWLEGLKHIASGYSLRTYNDPQGVVIKRNTFVNCHYCIYLNHGGTNWTITDNTITGDVDPASGTFSGEGIELNHTSGHVVAYNRISRVADGISYPTSNVDIYGNDIFDVSDDGIEGDYGYANVRIWGNRISNPLHNGISFQPMNGAPWYVIRNQVAAPLEDALKLRDNVDRVLLAHNTLVAWSGPQSSETYRLLSMQSNNNLWISVQDRYAWENGSGGVADWRTNLDYDGFDWGNYQYAFKWGSRYPDLAGFTAATGLEPNGIRVDKNNCFTTFNIPNPPPAAMPFQFMTLRPGCNAIDAGVVLPNVNEDYQGSAPDLGAYEAGADLPHYGPRSTQDLILTGAPADQTIYLSWQLNATLPTTATWQISYTGPAGNPPSPITGLAFTTRNQTLTSLTNYTFYTITLNAVVDGTAVLTDTITVMPTDIFVYLPLATRN